MTQRVDLPCVVCSRDHMVDAIYEAAEEAYSSEGGEWIGSKATEALKSDISEVVSTHFEFTWCSYHAKQEAEADAATRKMDSDL